MNPSVNYDCGKQQLIEGCYCKTGYVLDPSGNCILPNQCGCLLPDNSTVLAIGQTLVDDDCTKVYKCEKPLSNPSIEYRKCSANSHCESGLCKCSDGSIKDRDGYQCPLSWLSLF